MLAIEFTFPAGRYHATPWERHVNEGAVEWPPEPWRLLRALIATWHHKVKHGGRHGEFALLGLIESLAEDLPQYRLPPASHSHTRHYMPQQKPGDTSLVFDAFTAVARNEPLQIIWPNVNLPDEQSALLDDILAVIGYLGRAESWVEAKRVDQPDEANCIPGEEEIDAETGKLRGEVIALLSPLSLRDYGQQRARLLTDKQAIKKLSGTLPDNLLGALSVENADLRKQGWSQPPAARKVHYLRPLDALHSQRLHRAPQSPQFTSVVYLLTGKPLPRVEDTVRIGELIRRTVMSKFGELGLDVPVMISGHGLEKGNRHRHAFYLPYDANGDGRIDRVLLHVPAGMRETERRVIEKIWRMWNRDGGDWRLVLERIGATDVGGILMEWGTEWCSVTPYLHPWHVKKRFTIEDQISRECRERGLPELLRFECLTHVRVGNQDRRPIHFHRFRSKRGLIQPDRHGSFWRLVFAEPVSGPLALGYGCHFGLGLFSRQ